MNSRFISFEGPEGGGKSTQIARLAERLRERGEEVILTREPGGTPLCEAIRGMLQFDSAAESPLPRTEVLLFCASRAQLVDGVIRPALERGAWVLVDRFFDSTFAYQGWGRGFPLDELRMANSFATGGLTPARTFLLDLDYSAARARIGKRVADRFEREAEAFHRRVREGFLALAAEEPQRIKVIDASSPLEEVAEIIWRATNEL